MVGGVVVLAVGAGDDASGGAVAGAGGHGGEFVVLPVGFGGTGPVTLAGVSAPGEVGAGVNRSGFGRDLRLWL